MKNEPVAWDRGTWTVGETESQEFIESSDFNHDVRLYLNGDFEDDTQRLNYLQHIADRLNTHPVELTDEDCIIPVWLIENLLETTDVPYVLKKFLEEAILRKAQK